MLITKANGTKIRMGYDDIGALPTRSVLNASNVEVEKETISETLNMDFVL
jgi:hypothetical protein